MKARLLRIYFFLSKGSQTMIVDNIYKISAFGDFANIAPTPDTMLFMIESFKKYNMVPSIFQEMSLDVNMQQISMSTPIPHNRLAIISNDNQERLMISLNRLDFEIIASGEKGLDNLENYNEKILDSFSIVFDNFKKNSNRLAVNARSFIVNLDENKIKSILDKFPNPIQIYNKNPLNEWQTNLVTRNNINICGELDQLNIITIINKTKMMNHESNLFSDCFQIDIDINTIPEKDSPRFDTNTLGKFIPAALNYKAEIFEDIKKLL